MDVVVGRHLTLTPLLYYFARPTFAVMIPTHPALLLISHLCLSFPYLLLLIFESRSLSFDSELESPPYLLRVLCATPTPTPIVFLGVTVKYTSLDSAVVHHFSSTGVASFVSLRQSVC
ncbi:hypothetical protein DFH06DRAFT_64824 [Mycena polygramma]|nr:hypothetical protein DFH06DRAFT_64824 [Mycena polygramma]